MAINELSVDARTLADKLGEIAIGATITYEDLSNVLKRDVRQCRQVLYTAMKVILRERGIAFAQVRKIGYRRIRADEAYKIGSATRAHIRRSARRARKSIGAVQSRANDLAPDIQRQASAEISSLSLIEHISRDKIATAMNDDGDKPLPVAATAKKFLEKIGAT